MTFFNIVYITLLTAVLTLIANLVAEHGRDGFLAAWLRARDVGWAADLIPTFEIPQATQES